MSRNKIIFWLTLFAAILILALPTFLNIIKNHQDRLYQVATKKIIESAESCFYDDVCEGTTITIGELKKKGYLKEDVVNPKTKMYFEESVELILDNFHVQLKK